MLSTQLNTAARSLGQFKRSGCSIRSRPASAQDQMAPADESDRTPSPPGLHCHKVSLTRYRSLAPSTRHTHPSTRNRASSLWITMPGTSLLYVHRRVLTSARRMAIKRSAPASSSGRTTRTSRTPSSSPATRTPTGSLRTTSTRPCKAAMISTRQSRSTLPIPATMFAVSWLNLAGPLFRGASRFQSL